jgi:hypothetical protein
MKRLISWEIVLLASFGWDLGIANRKKLRRKFSYKTCLMQIADDGEGLRVHHMRKKHVFAGIVFYAHHVFEQVSLLVLRFD